MARLDDIDIRASDAEKSIISLLQKQNTLNETNIRSGDGMKQWMSMIHSTLQSYLGKTTQNELRQMALQKIVTMGASPEQQTFMREKIFREKPAETARGRGIYYELTSKAEFVLQEWIKKGGDVTALETDMETLLQLRLNALKLQLEANNKLAKTEEERQKVLNAVVTSTKAEHDQKLKMQKAEKRMTEILDRAHGIYSESTGKITGLASRVPFVGEPVSKSLSKYFERPEVRERLTKVIADRIGGGGIGGKALGMAGGEGAATFGGALGMGALIGGIAILAALLGLVVKFFISLVMGSLQFNANIVKAAGVGGALAGHLEAAAGSTAFIAKNFEGGVQEGFKAAAETAGAMVKSFGSILNVTSRSVEMTYTLSKWMGISAEQAADFSKFLTFGLGMSVVQTKEFLKNFKISSDIAGVSFAQGLRDIAESSNAIATFWHGTTDQLGRAVINARLMGSSLAEQLKTAESFSTFEQAAQNAMTLQVLGLGKFNALQMFTTANYGDATKLHEEIIDALIREGGLQSMNVASRKALAGILGVEVGQLAEVVKHRMEEQKITERLSKLHLGRAGETELARGAVRRLMMIPGAKIDEGQVRHQMAVMAAEEKRARKMDARIASTATILGLGDQLDPLQRAMAAIYDWLETVLRPAVTETVGYLKDISRFVQGIFAWLNSSPEERNMALANAARVAQAGPGGGLAAILLEFIGGKGKAEGGVVTRPSLAGEKGPEVVLPLTGPGQQGFTAPFLRGVVEAANSGNMEKIDRLTDLLSRLLERPIQIQTKVQIDSREIAKALTEKALITG